MIILESHSNIKNVTLRCVCKYYTRYIHFLKHQHSARALYQIQAHYAVVKRDINSLQVQFEDEGVSLSPMATENGKDENVSMATKKMRK